ncbi:MAG: DUF6544 family protein [Anaerobacillus sp.]|uniref:DUF6544 family protein n=1 Tax=Anaerobacillus sp. TaxID=1872506 RepID=UPI00391AA8D3
MNILKIAIVGSLLIGGAALFIGTGSMLKLFNENKALELNKTYGSEKKITAEDIAHLPEPVQKYMNYVGFVNNELQYNSEVIWADSKIKLKPEQNWMDLQTLQFNSVQEPMRVAYMKGRMFGLPVEVREVLQAGSGNMRGKISGIIPLFNTSDYEVIESGLLTILSEVPLVSGYILAEYITWEPVDSTTAKARLRYGDYDVSGTFFFNEKGEYIRFETAERNYELPTGGYKKEKWTIIVEDYKDNGVYKHPVTVSAVWNLPEGDYTYWVGTISEVKTNVGGN